MPNSYRLWDSIPPMRVSSSGRIVDSQSTHRGSIPRTRTKRLWLSGSMNPCQGLDAGSIPASRSMLLDNEGSLVDYNRRDPRRFQLYSY